MYFKLNISVEISFELTTNEKSTDFTLFSLLVDILKKIENEKIKTNKFQNIHVSKVKESKSIKIIENNKYFVVIITNNTL